MYCSTTTLKVFGSIFRTFQYIEHPLFYNTDKFRSKVFSSFFNFILIVPDQAPLLSFLKKEREQSKMHLKYFNFLSYVFEL